MSPVSMARKIPSLADTKGARRQSPSSSSTPGASSYSTPAASRKAHSKSSVPERNIPRPPRVMYFLMEDLKEVDYESDTPFPA
ncbi:hypothetical protein Plhal703r1_c30g0118941 [Plasmopara halstedii]